jgi:hypothetical protein
MMPDKTLFLWRRRETEGRSRKTGMGTLTGCPEKDLLKTGSNLFALKSHLLWRPMFQIQLLISKIQPRGLIAIP